VHARKAWLDGLDPKQNRTIPPLRYDLVHQLKRERPNLTIEINGGLLTLAQCQGQLAHVDGVMVGRAAYEQPLRWAGVDREIHGDHSAAALHRSRISPSMVLRGLLPYADQWCRAGGRLWPIARHLVHLVAGIHGARLWRQSLSQAAGARTAGAEVLEAAAQSLEQRGY
jgi:tRNA-dihydrouridine synthase A